MTKKIIAASKIKIKNILIKKKYSYPVKSCALEYKYLGHRNYTHGSSMLEGMIKTIMRFKHKENLKIFEFKVIKQFNNFSYTEAFDERHIKRHPGLKKAVAILILGSNKKKYACLLFKQKEKIKQRLDQYRSQNYIRAIHAHKNKSIAKFKNISDFIDLVRAINEGNRQLTLKEMPDDSWRKKIRWAYIHNLDIVKNSICKNFTSVIFVVDQDIQLGNKRFVIKKGKIISKKKSIKFKICFYIQAPQ